MSSSTSYRYKKPQPTVAEKLAIVAEYEEAPVEERGAVLRRHDTYKTTVARWIYARDHDQFGPGPKGKRQPGRSMTPRRQSAEIARLRRELAKAQADREVLDAALESLGKAHALLEKASESADPESLKSPTADPAPAPTKPRPGSNEPRSGT